jgi:hypothetical protein
MYRRVRYSRRPGCKYPHLVPCVCDGQACYLEIELTAHGRLLPVGSTQERWTTARDNELLMWDRENKNRTFVCGQIPAGFL